MTIEIIETEQYTEEGRRRWRVELEITQGGQTWALPATAPGELLKSELLVYFGAREGKLWRIADQKKYPPDVFDRIRERQLLKAFALVVLDEINILRQAAGLQPREASQIVTAIKAKLRN